VACVGYRYGARTYSTREIGAVMHGLHVLAVYDERFYGPADPVVTEQPEAIAAKPSGR